LKACFLVSIKMPFKDLKKREDGEEESLR